MTKTKFGSFNDLLDLTEGDLRPIVRRLKAIIIGVHPEAHEVVRLGDRAATYGVGPRKMLDGYCYILPHKSWVNLGFYKGAILEDPVQLLEGTGKMLRHIKIASLEDCDREDIKQLIHHAWQERARAFK